MAIVDYTPVMYVGLSGDTKPTDPSVRDGYLFQETNTNKVFVYEGGSWYESGTAMPESNISFNVSTGHDHDGANSKVVLASVYGPVSSTDHAVPRWDGAGGDTLQDSGIIIDDSGIMDLNSQKIIDLGTPTNGADAVTKEYVDTAVSNVHWEYHLNDTASGIGSYFIMAELPTGDAESTFTSSPLGEGDGQALTQWISDTTVPFDTVESGVIDFHVHVARTVGNRSVAIYCEIYEYKADTSEVLIATTEVSSEIDTKISVSLHATLPTDYEIASTSKVLVKALVNIGSSGADSTVALYAEGANSSRLGLPVPFSAFNDVYVRGPASATNNAIARFHETSGKVIQDYTSGAPTIGDTGIITLGNTVTLNSQAFDAGSGDAAITTTGSLKGLDIRGSNSFHGPKLRLWHNHTTPDVNVIIGLLTYLGYDGNASPATFEYGSIGVIASNVTDTTEEGTFEVRLATAGAEDNLAMTLSGAGDLWLDGSITLDAGETVDGVDISDFDALAVSAVEAAGLDLGENVAITLDDTLSADGKYCVTTALNGTAGEQADFGEAVYFKAADSKWWLGKGDAEVTLKPMTGLVVVAGAAEAAIKIALIGEVRADAAFPALTIGAPVFISAGTAGAVTTTELTTGQFQKAIGWAKTANVVVLTGNPDWVKVA